MRVTWNNDLRLRTRLRARLRLAVKRLSRQSPGERGYALFQSWWTTRERRSESGKVELLAEFVMVGEVLSTILDRPW